jgi:hypothetical protein
MTVLFDANGRTYAMGRIPSPEDERDQLHLMKMVLPPKPAAVKYRHWRTGPVLNQGETPHCVGFTWAQWEMTSPVRRPAAYDGNARGHAIYAACKKLDGSPKRDGTYVRMGAKVEGAEGRVQRYIWADSLASLKNWVLLNGPVCVGTDWYESMFDPKGAMLVPAGQKAGGHAWLVTGYNSDRDEFTMVNSWGKDWADGGRARIASAVLWKLLSEGGEAVAAIEQAATLTA